MKQSRIRPDHLIESRKRDEQIQASRIANKSYYERSARLARFASDGPKSLHQHAVNRVVSQYRNADESLIEERRIKLRALYDADSALWRDMLIKQQVTPGLRVEGMRKRVAELKAKREQERLRVVNEKLEDQKRRNCDELRTIKSKVMTHTVTEARAEQVQAKQAIAYQAKVVDIEFDKQWERHRLEKEHRHHEELARRHKANMDQAQTITDQIQQLQLTRERIHNEEQAFAKVMHQLAETQKMEQEFQDAQHALKCRQARQEMEHANQVRKLDRIRDAQHELKKDQEWIQRLLDLDKCEKDTSLALKAETRKDLEEFQNLVRLEKQAEIQRSKEIDHMYEKQTERYWEKQASKWASEQAKRKFLIAQVLASRHEQLQEHAQLAKARIDQQHVEKQLVQERVLLFQKEELAKRGLARTKQLAYKDALLKQIQDNRERRERFELCDRHDFEKQYQVDLEYEQWVHREVQRMQEPLSSGQSC